MDTFINIWLGFGINLAIVFIIVRGIYFPNRRNQDWGRSPKPWRAPHNCPARLAVESESPSWLAAIATTCG